jgi:hypothetical protein
MRAMCGCVDTLLSEIYFQGSCQGQARFRFFFHKRLRPFYRDQLEGDGNLNAEATRAQLLMH